MYFPIAILAQAISLGRIGKGEFRGELGTSRSSSRSLPWTRSRVPPLQLTCTLDNQAFTGLDAAFPAVSAAAEANRTNAAFCQGHGYEIAAIGDHGKALYARQFHMPRTATAADGTRDSLD